MEEQATEAENERLDDLVDEWHKGGSGMTLREFLGLSVEAYEHWLKNGSPALLIQ